MPWLHRRPYSIAPEPEAAALKHNPQFDAVGRAPLLRVCAEVVRLGARGVSELYFPRSRWAMPRCSLARSTKPHVAAIVASCPSLSLFAVLEPRCAGHRALIKNLLGEKALCPRESRARRFLGPSEGAKG